MTDERFDRQKRRGFFSLFKKVSDDFFISFDNPFSLCASEADFINAKLASLYKRILGDCYTKSKGWETETEEDKENRVSEIVMTPEEKRIASLWDSFATIEDPRGLISLLADAMAVQKEVFIVYEEAAGVVREANTDERQKIRKDYKSKGSSEVGIVANFRKYYKSLILKLYLSLLYGALGSAYTNLRIGQALKFKISKLREAVSKMVAEDIYKQAKAITDALKSGQSVAVDKEDDLEVNETNNGSVKEMMTDFYSEIASELGVSLAYVKGELTSGMSVTGDADLNYNEAGIKNFFDSIFKPCCDALYKIKLVFISDKKFYKVMQFSNALITIENSDLLSDQFKEDFAKWLGDENAKAKVIADLTEPEADPFIVDEAEDE